MANILIIDDSPATRLLLRRILELANHHVSEASDGSKGLLRASMYTPDLVIVDVNMPNLNGPQFVTRLRSLEQFDATPVLVFSAEVSQRNMQEASLAGADAWMQKPTRPKELLRAIDTLLKRDS